ncbi:MAG: MerR family transcriptional regulator [Alphaproteobacteria bacterium]|nr:MerR family transcriptional regulator [Alphaproteobacteria bacterium]MCB9695667.1 MerR family transcriptional regulator [Alphaproteobacteria bacterium]
MEGPRIGIGAVSRATGIPEPTLRTWERRYGFPEAIRTGGGHRLYDPAVIEDLKLASRALQLGHRPATVLGASRSSLRALVGADDAIGEWLEHVRRLDATALDTALRAELTRRGLQAFLLEGAVPFLRRVGEAWARGDLRVFHEHFASERLRELLAGLWRQGEHDAARPVVVCGALPGEHHVLGLHMAAALLSVEGCRVLFVGGDTPPTELAECARQAGAVAVVVAVSGAADPRRTRAELAELVAAAPEAVAILTGGQGAPEEPGRRVDLADLPGEAAAWV